MVVVIVIEIIITNVIMVNINNPIICSCKMYLWNVTDVGNILMESPPCLHNFIFPPPYVNMPSSWILTISPSSHADCKTSQYQYLSAYFKSNITKTYCYVGGVIFWEDQILFLFHIVSKFVLTACFYGTRGRYNWFSGIVGTNFTFIFHEC